MAKKKSLPPGVRERNGRYTFRYDIPDPATGERIQKETPAFNTAKEAYEKGIRIKAKLLTGTYIDEKNILFPDWADQWLAIYEATGKVKQRTVYTRMFSLKIAKERFAGTKLKELTAFQYQELLNDMRRDGFAKSTIDLLHAPMKMLYRKAIQLKMIENNITAEVEIPTFQQTVEQLETEEELPQYLEKEELAKLLKTAREMDDPQGFHALFVLAYTGMRIGELCALKTSDIDEVNRSISITKTLYDRFGVLNFQLNTPKTKSSIRKIDVSETVIKILRQQAAWRKEYRISVADKYYKEAEFVFVNEKKLPGYPSPMKRFDEFMKLALEKAGLPTTLTPHSLRHTYTSLMAEAGVELPAIQRLLGHLNDNVTRRVYLHVTKPKKREAVEKLDSLMNGLL